MPAKLLARLTQLETAVYYKTLPPKGERPFTYQSGDLPLLISAPHATAHKRNHRLKGEEAFTGAFAQYLAARTGSHALFSHYRLQDDPNWHRVNPYKNLLARLVKSHDIRFVLDLHGMSNRHKIGLALGTMNGRSCPNHESQIVQALQEHQFQQISQAKANKLTGLYWDHFVLNHTRFTGGLTNHTITRFVSGKLNIPALQIELCATLRMAHQKPEGIQAVLKMLQYLILLLATAV